jgi:hypothetical protein
MELSQTDNRKPTTDHRAFYYIAFWLVCAAIGFLVMTLTTGCNNLQTVLNTALADEQAVDVAGQEVIRIAQASIPLLPADKQAQAQADLTTAANKFDDVLAAAIATTQAAIAADNSNGINITQLEADITAAIQAIISVMSADGVDVTTMNLVLSKVATHR